MSQRVNSGSVAVVTGCMFSGKTGELLRRIRNYKIADVEVGVFSPAIDDRYGTTVIGSHNGEQHQATVIGTGESGMKKLYRQGRKKEAVVIDEANFFEQCLVSTVQEISRDGVNVIVSGLDQTFTGEPFSPVDELMAIADPGKVRKLTAICEVCSSRASRTQRLIEGEPAPSNADTIAVGGNEMYEARCKNCHVVPNWNQSL